MVLERVRRVAAATFKCKPEEISGVTVADDIAGWDSLSYTIFLMNVETEFGIEFDARMVSGFDCVGDLVAALVERA
jgi:acyl carrier protein